MKKYTHAWLSMMAMKRIDKAKIPERQKDDARELVRWFNNYRDFVLSGAWYPDSVFKDMSSSHIVKYLSDADSKDRSFREMPKTLALYNAGLKSRFYMQAFTIKGGNLCDRCESFTESLVDSFKILYSEGYGSPITPSCNHIAMRFFILSHYIADAHMPLHCDARSFANKNEVHAFIEDMWDKQVRQSYRIDENNNRFFYDPEGYPLKNEMTPLIRYVEEELERREFIWAWGAGCRNTWDYMSGITQYSFLLSRDLVPDDRKPEDITTEYYRTSEAFTGHFEEYSRIILADAVESIAKVWLHAWVRYRDWWRGCELAGLRANVADAQKAYKAAGKIIQNAPDKLAALKEKVAKCSNALKAQEKAWQEASSKGKGKAEAYLAKAKDALGKAEAALEAAQQELRDTKDSLDILSAKLKSAEYKCKVRTEEYKKYADSNSGI